MKKSIEVEYWVIDQNGALTTPGELTDVSEFAEEEFVAPLFELKTPPCDTIEDLRETFVDQLDEVLTRADELGKLLVPLETPVNCGPIDISPCDRGQVQRRVIGTDFDYAKYCAGTHVHFEQRNVTDQLNVLTSLDPALALLNSSPYHDGERIAAGARSYIYRKTCYRQLPEHGQLWDYADTVGEWKRRLDSRYEEFRAAAIERGVDPDAVAANFAPDDVVWTPVRLRSAMPTVEWRSPPAALPSQILRLVETAETLMEAVCDTTVSVTDGKGGITSDGIELPAFETLRAYSDEAMREGLQSSAVTAYLERMGFDVADFDPISPTIDGQSSVSRSRARQLRLRYGRLLREDVNGLTRDSSQPPLGTVPNGTA